jgi:hypothetical protein
MKNLLRKAQADVLDQVQDTGLAMHSDSVKRILVTGALVLASAFSMASGAHAQQNSDTTISNGAQRVGQILGNEAGRGQNMGNEFGNILGVGLNTIAKVMTGQSVNGSDVGGTLGQIGGAVVGYKMGDSPVGKAVGVVVGGAAGSVVGGKIGGVYDMHKANEQSAPVQINAADQQSFVDGMRAAAAKRQSVSFTQNGANPTQVAPQQAGYGGYMAQTLQKSRLQLLSSGSREMPNDVMLAVANKAMEVVKVGKAYEKTTDAWDNAFLNNRTPAVKTDINNALVDTADLLKAKTFEYVQVRNAAAAQGYDVSLIDGSVANNLASLKNQTNYGFKVAARGSQLTNNF